MTADEKPEHDHTGADWQCEACKPLADVLRARMRWPSLHWGSLHEDAWPSLARAVHDAGYVGPETVARLEDEIRELRIVAGLGTELHNHHNARVCPYCTPNPGDREERLFLP